MSSQNRAVARQTQADSLRQVVHRVGREHARTASAAGAGTVLHFGQFLVRYRRVGTLHHGGDEVEILALVLAGFHRSARDEDGRDVQAHSGHEHARGYLVTVGDAYHGIGLVCIHHVFHRVSDDIARRQRIEHAVVSHSDAVVNSNGVELGRVAAQAFYFGLDNLACLVQMGVSWDKLCEGVHDGDDRSAELFALHAVCHPQGTCPSHASPFGAHGASQLMFHLCL